MLNRARLSTRDLRMPLTSTTVPSAKSTKTTPALGKAEMGKSAAQQISEGLAAPDQPEIETKPEDQPNQ